MVITKKNNITKSISFATNVSTSRIFIIFFLRERGSVVRLSDSTKDTQIDRIGQKTMLKKKVFIQIEKRGGKKKEF